MSHRDAIFEAVAEVEKAEGLEPQLKAKLVKVLKEAARFLHKNQANLRDNFARAAISGAAYVPFGPGMHEERIARQAYSVADELMLTRMKVNKRADREGGE